MKDIHYALNPIDQGSMISMSGCHNSQLIDDEESLNE